ncbi:MAG TPA: cytochrome b/b6 domain-containing protein [Mycobacterium sp.]|nr:cytochrome b/b6 domain-containing protein [Mycobacterium sp.]
MGIAWKALLPPVAHEWQRPVRWLHFGLALTITLQLLSSLAMPSSDSYYTGALGLAPFRVHEYFGLFAALIVTLHWLWMPLDRGGMFVHLFPCSRRGRCEVVVDMRRLARGRLSGLVHGLGLLTATAMGATGVLLYLLMGSASAPLLLLSVVALLHSLIGNLMRLYLRGHVLLAAVHHLAGHATLRRMFSWLPGALHKRVTGVRHAVSYPAHQVPQSHPQGDPHRAESEHTGRARRGLEQGGAPARRDRSQETTPCALATHSFPGCFSPPPQGLMPTR